MAHPDTRTESQLGATLTESQLGDLPDTLPDTLDISEEWEHVDPTQIPSHTDLTPPPELPVHTWWDFAAEGLKVASVAATKVFDGASVAATKAAEVASVTTEGAKAAAKATTKAATKAAKVAKAATEGARVAASAVAKAAGVATLTLTPPQGQLPAPRDLLELLGVFLHSRGLERAPTDLLVILQLYARFYGSADARAQVRAVEALEKLQAYLRRTFWLFLEVQGLQECKEQAKVASLSIQLRSVLDARESDEVKELLQVTKDTIDLEKRQRLRDVPSPPSQ